MDPDNPVVQLCLAGMQAEAEGRMQAARELFSQAWEAHTDDFEACIAAHYVARHQVKPEDTFHWNQVALSCADAVGDERVRGFYSSLYLNMGFSCEVLGNWAEASRYYELAVDQLDALPDAPYRDLVQKGISAGRIRTSPKEVKS